MPPGKTLTVRTGRVMRPLSALSETAERLAAGDFRVSGAAGSNDEIGRVATDIDAAVGSIGAAVQEIAEHSRALASSSDVLSGISNFYNRFISC